MNENIFSILVVAITIIGFSIVGLIALLIFMNLKEKRARQRAIDAENETVLVKKSKKTYSPESIIDFMEFEKVEDGMIVQKNGKFLMVIECHGINYDLMSEVEQASVEQGFIAFLNTLRYPVQIHIQTRKVNLEKSILGYKDKLREIDEKYDKLKNQYEDALKEESTPKQEIQKIKYEMVKQKNLRDYTADIIRDIERQSLNQNILNKRYYVIVPCYKSEIEAGEFDKNEIRNMAYSELYNRSRAIINALFSCQVTGKILDSKELVELLYIAYNRDESDLFSIDKINEAGFEDLYSTAPDVIEKKMKILDKQIAEKSAQLANEKIKESKSEKELELLEMEKNEKELINARAKELIRKHKKYIGEDIANKAIDKINNSEREKQDIQENIEQNIKEEVVNEIPKEKAKRGRPRKK